MDALTGHGHILSQGWRRGDPADQKAVKQHLKKAKFTASEVAAETVAIKIEPIERLDRMLATLEGRRNSSLRELDRHRAALTARTGRSRDMIDDADFVEIERAPREAAA